MKHQFIPSTYIKYIWPETGLEKSDCHSGSEMQFSTFPMMMMMVGWAFAFIYNQVHINIKVWTWRGKVCIPKLSQISINGCSSKIIYTTSNILCTLRKKIMQQYRREVSWGFGTRYILGARVTCQLFSIGNKTKT